MKMGNQGILQGLCLLFLCHIGAAHVSLTYPQARGYPLDFLHNFKSKAPCGMPDFGEATNLREGSDVQVEWSMSYPHEGGFKLQILENDTVVHNLTEQFVDAEDRTLQKYTVTLPEEYTCENCSIRLLRKASDWHDNLVFWTCSRVNIQKGSSFERTCSNRGKLNSNGVCICDKLYSGVDCQNKDDCWDHTDCNSHGQCVDIQGSSYPKKQCFCEWGWHGKNCQYESSVKTLDDFSPKKYVHKQMVPGFDVYYKLITDEEDMSKMEMEIVLKVQSSSYVALGWKPNAYTYRMKGMGKSEPEAESEAEGEPESEPEGEPEGERESSAEGEKEGMAEGEKEWMAEGEKEGMAEGEKEGMAEGERNLWWAEVEWAKRKWAFKEWAEKEWAEKEGGAEGEKQLRAEGESEWAEKEWAEKEWAEKEWAEKEWAEKEWAEKEGAEKEWAEKEGMAEGEKEGMAEGEGRAESEMGGKSEGEPEGEAEAEGRGRSKRKVHPMHNSDMVIGSARGKTSRVMDYWTISKNTPREDEFFHGKNSLTAAIGKEENGVTTILFRKPVRATEMQDHSFAKGYLTVIYAYGQNETPPELKKSTSSNPDFYKQDELKYHGGGRGKTYINFLKFTKTHMQVSLRLKMEWNSELKKDSAMAKEMDKKILPELKKALVAKFADTPTKIYKVSRKAYRKGSVIIDAIVEAYVAEGREDTYKETLKTHTQNFINQGTISGVKVDKQFLEVSKPKEDESMILEIWMIVLIGIACALLLLILLAFLCWCCKKQNNKGSEKTQEKYIKQEQGYESNAYVANEKDQHKLPPIARDYDSPMHLDNK